MNKYNINKGDLLSVDNILFKVLATEGDQIKVAVVAGHSNSSQSYYASTPDTTKPLNTGENVLDYSASNINNYLENTVFTAFSQNIQEAAVSKPFTCYVVYYPAVTLGTGNYLKYSYYQDTNMIVSKHYTIGNTYTVPSKKIRGASIQDIIDYYEKDTLEISAHEIGQLFYDPSFVDFSPTGNLSDYWLVDSFYNSNYATAGGTYMTGLYLDGVSYNIGNSSKYTWVLNFSTSYAYSFPIMWLDLTKLVNWINVTPKLKRGTFTFNTTISNIDITGRHFESNGREFSKLYCSGNNVFYDALQVRNSSGWFHANYRTIHIPARSDVFVKGTFSSINTFLKSGNFSEDNKIGISLLDLLPNTSTSNLKVKVLKTGEADQNLTSLLSAPITYDCGKAGYEYVSNITNGSLQAMPKLKTGQSHDTEVQANAGYFPPNDLSVYDITGSTKITSSYNTVTPPGSWAYDKFNGKVAIYSALGSAQFKGDCISSETYAPVELGSGINSPELWYTVVPDTASSSGLLSNWDSKISALGTSGVATKIIIADKLYDTVYYKATSWYNTYLGTKLYTYSKQLMAKSTATGAEIALAWMNQSEEWDRDAWKKVTNYYKNNHGHALIFLDPVNDTFYNSEAWEMFKLYFAPAQGTLSNSTIKFNLQEISYADAGCEVYAISYNKDADKVYKIPLRARSSQESVVAACVWSLVATSEDTEYYYDFNCSFEPTLEEYSFPKDTGLGGGEEDGVNAINYFVQLPDLTLTSINIEQWSCLASGTLITMSDSTQKKVEEVQVGDTVLGYDWNSNKLVSQVVTAVNKEVHKTESFDLWGFDDGTSVGTVNPHEFFNVEANKFKYIADFKIGEHTYKLDGTTPMLISHEVVKTPIQYYRITTNTQTNYFANNLLSGNRACPQGLTVELLNKGNNYIK